MKTYEQVSSESANVSPREYVQACLDLVNWRPGDKLAIALRAMSRVYGKDPQTVSFKSLGKMLKRQPAPEGTMIDDFALVPGGFADGMRKRLETFLFGDEQDKKMLRAIRDVAISDVTTRVKLHLSSNGELIHRYRYVPKSQDAKDGLLLAFLFAPNETFGSELRQCPFCTRYFLSVTNPNGGPRPRFCPGTDHQELYDDAQAPIRNKKNRANRLGQARATRNLEHV